MINFWGSVTRDSDISPNIRSSVTHNVFMFVTVVPQPLVRKQFALAACRVAFYQEERQKNELFISKPHRKRQGHSKKKA